MTRLTSDIPEAMLIIAAFMNIAKTASGKADTALLLEPTAAVKTLFDVTVHARERRTSSRSVK